MQCDTCATSPELLVERQLCFLLHRNTARFLGRWDRFLRRYSLTYTEYLVILAIWERSPVSENALALRLQFDPYTLEDALTNLERARFVSRSDDHGIPGHRVVEATQHGMAFQPEILEIRSRFSCELGLAPKDAELLTTQLEKLADALAGLDPEDDDTLLQPV